MSDPSQRKAETLDEPFLRDYLLIILVIATASISVLTSTTYGYQDDYNYLANGEILKWSNFLQCTSHGRPLYGLLIEFGFYMIESVGGFLVLRWLGVLYMALTLGLLYRILLGQGYSRSWSLATVLSVGLLPPALIIVNWATIGPYALSTALGLLAYWLSEICRLSGGGRRKAIAAGAVLCFAGAVLIFQPSALFYLVPFGTRILRQRGWTGREAVAYFAWHIATVVTGIVLALCILKLVLTGAGIEAHPRTSMTDDWLSKLADFWRHTLPGALKLFLLSYNFEGGTLLNRGLEAGVRWIVVIILAAGVALDWTKRNWMGRAVLLAVALGLFPATYIINMAAAEVNHAYRAAFSLAAWTAVFFLWALAVVLRSLRLSQACRLVLYMVLVGLGWWLANYHVTQFVYLPQQLELAFLREKTWDWDIHSISHVYLVEGKWGQHPSVNWDEEFGVPTTFFPWGSEFLLLYVVQERHPDMKILQPPFQLTLSSEKTEEEVDYDTLVDCGEMARFRN